MKKNPNELLETAKKEIKNLNKGDTFVVKDLFKGYEWNKIDRADRLRLGVLFLSWAQGDGKKIIKIEEKTHSGQQAYIKYSKLFFFFNGGFIYEKITNRNR